MTNRQILWQCIAVWDGIEADTQEEMINEDPEYLDSLDQDCLATELEEPIGRQVGDYIVTENRPLEVWLMK